MSRVSLRRSLRDNPPSRVSRDNASPVSPVSPVSPSSFQREHVDAIERHSALIQEHTDALKHSASVKRSSSHKRNTADAPRRTLSFQRDHEKTNGHHSSLKRSSSYKRDRGDDADASSYRRDHEDADDHIPSHKQVSHATRPRLLWALLTAFLLFVTVVMLAIVEVGSIFNKPVLKNIYFIKLDLSNIIPLAVPNSRLINSIAQTLGLHDFYTVGLWSFCEGYNGKGITDCSHPKTLYWFNPVEILQSQLLAGASIALPADVDKILKLIRLVSHWMFGLFLAGAGLSFIMIFLVPISVVSHWAAIPTAIFTVLAALVTTVAAVLATVMFTIMRNAIGSVQQLNINANLGLEMFIFMWIASGAAIAAAIIQLCMICCCASRRDVETGRKAGSLKHSASRASRMSEKKPGQFSGRLNGASRSTRRYSDDEDDE